MRYTSNHLISESEKGVLFICAWLCCGTWHGMGLNWLGGACWCGGIGKGRREMLWMGYDGF